MGSGSAASCAAGLNLLIQNYESGTQITYKLYSPEEITAQPSRDHAELYYFPADPPNARYAVVLSGNALYYSGELRGGVSTAWELHEQGYAVFVLRYRIGREAGNNAPMDDLGRAIQFITANAETFGVQPEGYALLGYSSGGQIAGVFGDAEKGWQKYNVPKPGALLLAYPINNFWLAKPAYTALLDVDDWMQKRLHALQAHCTGLPAGVPVVRQERPHFEAVRVRSAGACPPECSGDRRCSPRGKGI